jgi:hypothetical protein
MAFVASCMIRHGWSAMSDSLFPRSVAGLETDLKKF